ncbi:hypothetical protein AAVH_27434 [Aphelenchoides avenae]|nr:hypothetical protein AAVH_27434 [Aphelenchus avenae]
MLVHSPEFAADLRETMTTKKLDSPSIGESDVVEMEDEAPAKRARVGVKEKRVIAEERSAMEDTTHFKKGQEEGPVPIDGCCPRVECAIRRNFLNYEAKDIAANGATLSTGRTSIWWTCRFCGNGIWADQLLVAL